VYTIIDLFSRWAYAKVTTKISAAQSFHFVEEAMIQAPFKFQMVQTDNGPEFQKMFRHMTCALGLKHRHSRVRKSNDQAHIERFNRTIQEECLDRTEATIHSFRKAIKIFLPYYNFERSHMGINYKTPMEVLRSY
jgi:transposase InsO family protein